MDRTTLEQTVRQALADQPVTDLHTHCYTPKFGHSYDGTGRGLLLWGIDELVTYHYLIAEVFRVVPASELPYEKFWQMSKAEQADHIWQHLFVERAPISEACRGVLTTLQRLGLDPNEKTLEPYRKWFRQQSADQYIDKVMELANVDSITMTNEVFGDNERPKWEADAAVGDDPRFEAVLRIDPLLRDWPNAAQRLREWGYDVNSDFSGRTVEEARRFLREWIDYMKAIYVAVSLPPWFRYPSDGEGARKSDSDRVLEQIITPACAEKGVPFAMMIGSHRVNHALKDAGDIGGKAEITSVSNICATFDQNRFLVTMLSRENQHELCVVARKFGNLLPFGCWWFMNNPTLITEITRMRLELLGTTFAPQHSDARILDQLIYKWDHSRRLIGEVLIDKYADALDAGFAITAAHIRDDVRRLMRDNFRSFCADTPATALA